MENQAAKPNPAPPESSIKVRAKRSGEITQVRILIRHPMHTGRQKDSVTGATIPAHFIERLRVEHDGRIVADCRLSTAVSRDPYLTLRFRGGQPGDSIRVSWTDNRGKSDAQTAIIP